MTAVISLSEEKTLLRLAHLTLNHTSADKPGDNEEFRYLQRICASGEGRQDPYGSPSTPILDVAPSRRNCGRCRRIVVYTVRCVYGLKHNEYESWSLAGKGTMRHRANSTPREKSADALFRVRAG